MSRGNAVVVMATDVGRSPRARHLALALRDHGMAVTVIGADGTPTRLDDEPDVSVVRVRLPARDAGDHGSGVGRWAARAASRFGGFGVGLARALRASGGPDVIVVAVPPATPVLDVVMAFGRARRVPVVIDWHNLESAMVGLRLAQMAPAFVAVGTGLARRHEVVVARSAALHIAVTSALADALKGAGLGPLTTLEDHPVEILPRLTGRARMAARVARDLPPSSPIFISSSSFSIDDDTDFLARAMGAIARRRDDVTVLLTGDGPGRAAAVAQLSAIAGVDVRWRFVDEGDYLTTVSLCDVALCAHRSASGLDFPLKIKDATAAGLPSIAIDTGPVLRAGLGPGDRAARTPEDFADAALAALKASPVVHDPMTFGAAFDATVWPRLEALIRRGR